MRGILSTLRFAALALLPVIMMLWMSCALPAHAQTTAVTIVGGAGLGQLCAAERNCFSPQVLHVAEGTTVVWKNSDRYSHSVTSGSPYDNQVGETFDSHLLGPGKTFSFTFATPGTYRYFCEVHPWMTGVIYVSAQDD